jgi:putative addiction module component (TIGR02574 family)
MPIKAELVERTMRLPEGERAELARQLILSLEPAEVSAQEEQAWEAEIERRLAAHDRGEVTAIDWRDAVERARVALRGGNT